MLLSRTFWLGGVGLWLLGWLAVAHAQPRVMVSCELLLRDKLYAKAHRCFVDKAKASLLRSSRLNKLRKIQVGLQLQQAASAAEQMARRSRTTSHRSYWLEKACQALSLHYKRKLCVRRYRCRRILGKLTELRQQIGYGRLTVQLPPRQTYRIRLRGYRTTKTTAFARRQWVVKRLRPGPYTLVVTAPNGRRKPCKVVLRPGQEKQLRCAPSVGPSPLRRPPRPPAPVTHGPSGLAIGGWVVVGVGAAALITGGALLGVGQSQLTHRDTQAQALTELDASLAQEASVTLIPEVETLHQSAATSFAAGWAVGGVGVIALGVGLGMALWPQPKAPPPPAPRSRPKSVSSLRRDLLVTD